MRMFSILRPFQNCLFSIFSSTIHVFTLFLSTWDIDHNDHPNNHLDDEFIDDLNQVPLCQVNLSDGEQQWRLLHRMTGPRDQVINIIIIIVNDHQATIENF